MGGDTTTPGRQMSIDRQFQSQVAILGWGYPTVTLTATPMRVFQSQVAILGWGYRFAPSACKPIGWFQSQVAILGWGYVGVLLDVEGAIHVSIAGGDSWVGIPCWICRRRPAAWCFNRRWRFLGGDTRRTFCGAGLSSVSIAGGDSWVGIRRRFFGCSARQWKFQSQVAILGWGYLPNQTYGPRYLAVSIAGGDSWVGIPSWAVCKPRASRCFNRRWRFLGGDTVKIAAGLGRIGVSIAGGDSWVGIHGPRPRDRHHRHVSIAGGDSWVGIQAHRVLLA